MAVFLYSGMRGMLASVFLLGTVPSCLFSFLTCILAEVISVVALTSNVTREGISEMFVEWLLISVNVLRGWEWFILLSLPGLVLNLWTLSACLWLMRKDDLGALAGPASEALWEHGWSFSAFKSHHPESKWESDFVPDDKCLLWARERDPAISKADAAQMTLVAFSIVCEIHMLAVSMYGARAKSSSPLP